ncbi:MAG: FAD-dependent thymidylate synthase [Thermoprotei archaeon]
MGQNEILENKYKPFVKIIAYLPDTTRLIASAGKSTLSPKNIDNILSEMDEALVKEWLTELIKRGHGSPMEHSIYIYEVICSRAASHQLVRHRIASYTQLSQRYSDKYLRGMIRRAANYLNKNIPLKPKSKDDYREYSKILSEIVNTNIDFDELLDIVSEAFIIPPSIVRKQDKEFLAKLVENTAKYYEMLSQGIKPEDARYILPQAVKTRLIVSMNARELFESFLPLRMCSKAQWEIRYIAWNLWRLLARIHGELFEYAGPRCILIDNRIREKPCRLRDYLDSRCKPVITRCPELVDSNGILNCLAYASKDPWESLI